MNKIIKIYSHERSGTNLLLYTMYNNYYYNDKRLKYRYKKNVLQDVNKFYIVTENESKIQNNKMSLFGNHKPFNNITVKVESSIYIYRHPIDCLHSLYCLQNSGVKWYKKNNMSFSEWLTEKKIIYWKKHVDSYINNIFCIKYEDLIKKTEETLLKIEKKFNLTRIDKDRLVFPAKKIGWSPSLQAHEINELNRDLFRKVLGKTYLQYEI